MANMAQRAEPIIVIVGSGIAGVAAAHRLAQAGFQRLRILEATSRSGGRILTSQLGERFQQQRHNKKSFNIRRIWGGGLGKLWLVGSKLWQRRWRRSTWVECFDDISACGQNMYNHDNRWRNTREHNVPTLNDWNTSFSSHNSYCYSKSLRVFVVLQNIITIIISVAGSTKTQGN